jgi:hypothetical protein
VSLRTVLCDLLDRSFMLTGASHWFSGSYEGPFHQLQCVCVRILLYMALTSYNGGAHCFEFSNLRAIQKESNLRHENLPQL